MRVCLAGALGKNGAEDEEDEEARVGEASSARRDAFRDSRSMIYALSAFIDDCVSWFEP